jgi:hypothetical protein
LRQLLLLYLATITNIIPVLISPAWDETVIDSPAQAAYYETVEVSPAKEAYYEKIEA